MSENFGSLYSLMSELKEGTVEERMVGAMKKWPTIFISAIGGIPFQEQSGSFHDINLMWGGMKCSYENFHRLFKSALTESGLLTYMDRSNLKDNLAELMIQRKEFFGLSLPSVTITFAGCPTFVEMSFARDSNFHLSWVEKQTLGELRVFSATASLKDWKKYLENRNSKSFLAVQRYWLSLAHEIISPLFPEFFGESAAPLKKVLLIAPTGAGKTTLADLMQANMGTQKRSMGEYVRYLSGSNPPDQKFADRLNTYSKNIPLPGHIAKDVLNYINSELKFSSGNFVWEGVIRSKEQYDFIMNDNSYLRQRYFNGLQAVIVLDIEKEESRRRCEARGRTDQNWEKRWESDCQEISAVLEQFAESLPIIRFDANSLTSEQILKKLLTYNLVLDKEKDCLNLFR